MLLKNPQITNLIKIRPIGAEPSMRTDINDEANSRTVAFRNFANAPNKIKDHRNWCHFEEEEIRIPRSRTVRRKCM